MASVSSLADLLSMVSSLRVGRRIPEVLQEGEASAVVTGLSPPPYGLWLMRRQSFIK